MYIESIELDNFKSFGEKTFIPFFPGFTTVSGPNGSGKSNIIDSLLFAFGLSTNKTMRAERLTDLMNNLSGKRETQVSVVLYDEQNETQLKIARRIRLRLNGQYESTYFINSKISTLSEVHDQLALRNISPNAYNVVMQGDVTRIISMSPLERRRIIDELAGVADFDRKIEEAKLEISQASNSLEQQTILLSEFSDRLEVLKKERDQALKYTELKQKRNYLERLFRQTRIKELEAKTQKLKLDIENKATSKAQLMDEMSTLTEEYLEAETKSKELQAYLEHLNKNEKVAMQTELDGSREKLTREESGIEFLHKQINDYEKQIERIIKESKLGQKKISEISKQVAEVEEKENSFKREIDTIQNRYQQVQSKILEKSQKDNVSAGRVFELQEQSNQLQAQKADLTTEKALCEQNLQRLEEEIKALRNQLELSLGQMKQLETRAQGSKSRIFSDKINSTTKHLRRLKDELADTEQEHKDRVAQLYQYQNELSKLEMKKHVSEEQHFGRAIESVLRSGVKGVHGLLAQLASVPPQYAIALETSAGARLKSIVVDDDHIASTLIEFLRKNNAGRATFLPLSKIRMQHLEALPPEAKMTNSGVIGWAIDLVQCDELYLPAFSYAFGSTLVVKDLPSGRRYLGRYRMVTLQGDLLEKSGAMTGGSSPRESGIHFGVEDNAKAQQLAQQMQSLEKRVDGLKTNIDELKKEIAGTEDELDRMKSEWAQVRASEEIEDNSLKVVKEQIESGKLKLTEMARQRDQFEQNFKQFSSEIITLDRQLHKLNDSLALEGARVKDAGLESLINESQELEYERKRLEVNLRNIESSKSELQKGVEAVKGSIAKGEDEIVQAQGQIISLKEQIIEQDRSLTESRKVVKFLEGEIAKLQAQIDELEKSKTELSNSLLKLTKKKTEATESLKRLSEDIADGKIKLLDLEERLAALKQEVLSSEIQELEENDIELELKRHAQNLTEDQVKQELDKIERKMTALEPVNMKAIDEFNEVFERLREVKERCEGLSAERDEIEKRIASYHDHKMRSFFEAYNDVNKHFQDIFAELSFGHGELLLENQEDPFKGGLIIQARPRNKKMQRLESMSGGEKSLTALSFIFALQWHNPAPFYAFDEVDMFLDGLNAERLSKMVKKQSSLAQFIVVSLRKPMIQSSERAIGVFLGKDGFSKVAGMKSKEEIIQKHESSQLNKAEDVLMVQA